MKTTKWADVKKGMVRDGKITQAKLDQVQREVAKEVLQMNLRQLRDTAGITQVEMAGKLKVAQSRLSQLEGGEADNRLSTLRRYVEALGGEVKVQAVFGRKAVELVV